MNNGLGTIEFQTACPTSGRAAVDLRHRLKADIFEADLGAGVGRFISNLMDLKADESRRSHGVGNVRASGAVEVRLDGGANGFNSQMIPVIGFEDLAASLGELGRVASQLAGVEPQPAAFIIDSGCPPALFCGIGIDFDLVTVNVTGGDIDGLAFPLDLGVVVKDVAAELDTGIEHRIAFEIQIQDKVRIVLIRTEKAVGFGSGDGLADDATIFDKVFGFARALSPAGQVFAIEERHGR